MVRARENVGTCTHTESALFRWQNTPIQSQLSRLRPLRQRFLRPREQTTTPVALTEKRYNTAVRE